VTKKTTSATTKTANVMKAKALAKATRDRDRDDDEDKGEDPDCDEDEDELKRTAMTRRVQGSPDFSLGTTTLHTCSYRIY
jgi:hypothetical protein